MKNLGKLFGIIAIVAIIVFTMGACDDLFNGLVTSPKTPVDSDYNIDNLTQLVGRVTAVTVTPKSGKSPGTITIYYAGTGGTSYTKSTTLPTAVGTYVVTFDVAETTGWNAVTGLYAGTLTINLQTPVASDYDISNLTQTVSSVTAVTVIPKSSDKSPGGRTVYYEGTDDTTYAKSTTIPQAAGTYAVTFDVAAATGWNAATGLSAGTLTINLQTPVASDYNISNLTQTVGSVTAVTVTPKSDKSPGTITVYYEGTDDTSYAKSTTVSQAAGTYAVTFDVAAATGWNAVNGLSAGELKINP